MNKIYRLIWNAPTHTWIAVAEIVRARGKRASRMVTLAASLGLVAPGAVLAQAPPAPNQLPVGGRVVAGQAGLSQSGSTLTITQGSSRAALDWSSFNIGKDAQVHYQQPTGGVALNRINDSNASQIFGRLTASGQVFLSNPNGVYFSPSARVDVGGLVATTHRISLEDFMAGRATFDRQGASGAILNEGELRSALGGYIALLAPEVRNQGVIVANLGTVALAAGEAFELQFDANNSLAGLRVSPATVKALVENRHAVLAPGGLVVLSAQAVDRVQGGVVNNRGRVEATGLAQRGGRLVLEASERIENGGTLAANAGVDGPAGTLRLQASAVVNDGRIEARGVTESISGAGSAASLSSPTENSQAGGRLLIQAGEFSQRGTGVMDASGTRQGGDVAVQVSGVATLQGQVQAHKR
ncbi:MAG TPA: filamentous hemagglutinin N-terminal domain-containing protein [Accumulibacter sp.]|nr:filamentous hemagglutinin N-terminal domain-containing protein [Accumulibacter sp.]HMW16987.1 filamentous hemagglutinin N-terminal domain-containing protein [Accumulibacter sp.]HMX21837.1 filamentous hemagglutinin N-terminal domain-containing protein [Accumulibacter sp.]HNC17239.1 filamentous hemagglutinin N-terminal domain-containing protein [Accumulibacter sp.]HND79867.1 filamentous hemagglutinin N-terminal domain-containing protein [Accumulibacter sp.]